MIDDYTRNWQKQKIVFSKKHQLKAFKEINNLVIRKRRGKKVTLDNGKQLTEFMSCSYLGLDQDKRVVGAANKSIKQCGVNFAVARPRMRVERLVFLENLLNKIFGAFCTTFTSLHIVHLGILPLLASGEMPSYPIKKQGPLFILDKKVHASVQINRGLMEQFGEIILADFKDSEALTGYFKLAKSTGRTPLIIADGIGSMGGEAPIKLIFDLVARYKGYAYLDDAHGISMCGKHGRGYVLNELGRFHSRLILAVSLSKGFGANGAAIAVHSKKDEEMIRRFCIPYVFSNPPPLSIVDSAIASAKIHLSNEIYRLQDKLKNNIRLFDTCIIHTLSEKNIINYGTHSPIRGLRIGNEFKTIQIAKKLFKAKLGVTAAMYPTVARNESILRVTMGADHFQKDIKYLCETLKKIIHSG